MHRFLHFRLAGSLAALVIILACQFPAPAQDKETPLTSQEVVRLVYQIPANPGKRDEVVAEIRRRGIGFPLTDGLRSIVATKSGNDALLRRTLEEAERRRLNPVAAALPPEAEGRDILEKTRNITIAASEAMPDFIVRQNIVRSYALGRTNNWQVADRLTIAVSYRANAGEEYKVLAINGLPPNKEMQEGNSYEQVGGTSSTGEYVSMLAALFKPESQAVFKMVDTDVLRERRTIVYEFEVKKENSRQTIKTTGESAIVTGYRGRVWIDRELWRVLRLEEEAVEIPVDFPVSAASSLTDYDWVKINDRPYLLPSRTEIKLTAGRGDKAAQWRNVILFRNYQKFGSEVKIIDDIDEEELPEEKPQEKPASKP